uniref:Putative secreted peptide n=1 Tax=Anopheles braziliensis TaxID=58242 RepID=A0A2M3ZMJ9_9DIPT
MVTRKAIPLFLSLLSLISMFAFDIHNVPLALYTVASLLFILLFYHGFLHHQQSTFLFFSLFHYNSFLLFPLFLLSPALRYHLFYLSKTVQVYLLSFLFCCFFFLFCFSAK